MDRYILNHGVRGGWAVVSITKFTFSMQLATLEGEPVTPCAIIEDLESAKSQYHSLNKALHETGTLLSIRVTGGTLRISELITGITFRIENKSNAPIPLDDALINLNSCIMWIGNPDFQIITPYESGSEKKYRIISGVTGARNRECMSEQWKPVEVVFREFP